PRCGSLYALVEKCYLNKKSCLQCRRQLFHLRGRSISDPSLSVFPPGASCPRDQIPTSDTLLREGVRYLSLFPGSVSALCRPHLKCGPEPVVRPARVRD